MKNVWSDIKKRWASLPDDVQEIAVAVCVICATVLVIASALVYDNSPKKNYSELVRENKLIQDEILDTVYGTNNSYRGNSIVINWDWYNWRVVGDDYKWVVVADLDIKQRFDDTLVNIRPHMRVTAVFTRDKDRYSEKYYSTYSLTSWSILPLREKSMYVEKPIPLYKRAGTTIKAWLPWILLLSVVCYFGRSKLVNTITQEGGEDGAD